ncbi:MAG: hypothetical protein VYA34_01305 [Myxococcota bacterium]|nr:hypothetical protein [Myxococcota bacterium]
MSIIFPNHIPPDLLRPPRFASMVESFIHSVDKINPVRKTTDPASE